MNTINTMNTLRKSFLIGMTVLGMGTATLAAHADEGRPMAGHEHGKWQEGMAGHEQMAGKWQERMAKHAAMLHDKLKLTTAQEPAWKTFNATMMPQMPGGMPAHASHMDHAAIAKMSAPERLEKWIAFSKERIGKQEARLAALKTFYAVLTPEQKQVFDDSVPGGRHGPHRGHGMMHQK